MSLWLKLVSYVNYTRSINQPFELVVASDSQIMQGKSNIQYYKNYNILSSLSALP